MTFGLRRAERRDRAAIAEIWHAGWSDAHLGHVDRRLSAARTPASFVERTERHLTRATVATTIAVDLDDDRVAGFVMVLDDEVEQIYVATDHRGAGCAVLLLATAEQQIADAGYTVAWLAVVAQNDRARRFYERHGWSDHGSFTYLAAGRDRDSETIPVMAHRYEKRIGEG